MSRLEGCEGMVGDRDADAKEISQKQTEKRIKRQKTVHQARVAGRL
jgi:hypothetical protein